MPLIIGVRFNPAGKVYFFDPTGFEETRVGEYVVVETARGEEVGKVVVSPRQVSGDDIVRRLKGVVRKASAVDLTQMKYYQYRERDALVRCQAVADASAECSWGRSGLSKACSAPS